MNNNIENILKERYILVDTCSLMQKHSRAFLLELSAYLIRYKKRVIIPHKVLLEFQRKMNETSDPDLRSICLETKKVLDYMKSSELVNIKKGNDKETTFADPIFISQLIHFSSAKNKIVLITQDKGLADSIVNNVNKLSLTKEPVIVLCLDKWGALEEYNSLP